MLQLDGQLETICKLFLPSQSLRHCSLPPLLKDLGGWKEWRIFEFNNHKMTETGKKSYEDGGIVVGREEGLGIWGGPKEYRSFECVGNEISSRGNWHPVCSAAGSTGLKLDPVQDRGNIINIRMIYIPFTSFLGVFIDFIPHGKMVMLSTPQAIRNHSKATSRTLDT